LKEILESGKNSLIIVKILALSRLRGNNTCSVVSSVMYAAKMKPDRWFGSVCVFFSTLTLLIESPDLDDSKGIWTIKQPVQCYLQMFAFKTNESRKLMELIVKVYQKKAILIVVVSEIIL